MEGGRNLSPDFRKSKKKMAALSAFVLILFFMSSPFLVARQNTPQSSLQSTPQDSPQSMPDMQDMPGMDMSHGSMSMEETPAQAKKRLADKRESEFNHHLAGVLVGVAVFFLLIQERLAKRWPGVRYVWPCCILLAGVYLALFSDTEIWPVGHQTLWYAVKNNSKKTQTKKFSLFFFFFCVVCLSCG